MKSPTGLLKRAAVVATTLGVASTGVVVLDATTPAEAATRVLTPYGMTASNFATRVVNGQTGVESGRSAWSMINCTKDAGIVDQNAAAAVDAPGLQVGAATSRSVTYRAPKRGILAGVYGFNRVANVSVGQAGGPRLSLTALTTRTHVWRPKTGNRFHAATRYESGKLSLELLPEDQNPLPGSPLDDLLDGVNEGISGVLDALRENAGKIDIPGLGTVYQGSTRVIQRPEVGAASGYMLRIRLVDGTEVQIGRSFSRMDRDVPSGPMRGGATAIEVSALDGLLKTGRLGQELLPCPGTGGQVRSSSLLGLDPGKAGLVKVEAAKGEVFGIQRRTGHGRAWSRSTIGTIVLGGPEGLVITGLKAQANVVRNARGRVFTSSQGTSIGGMSIGGTPLEAPSDAVALPDGTPLQVETNVVERRARGIHVIALRITLAPGTPAQTVVRIGTASAFILRR